jgi:mono/diheme cytochrome c family protein
VWGPVLRALETSDVRARVRLDNLVAFIESLQRAPLRAAVVPVAQPDGSALFRDYCANCHGANGRGNGPMTAQLRRQPPDLTQYARRNGGVFPEARVARIIDGRDVPAHGSGEMPVWGDVFNRQPDADGAAVRARVEALSKFLASIQERVAE